MTDPISDLLARIKNGYMAKSQEITCFPSKEKLAVAKILEKEGYLEKVETDGRSIRIFLKYKEKQGAIESFKRISKPGLRVYVKHDKIKKPFGGIGISILSTPGGIMTGVDAKKKKLGGELLCQVW